jgi:hypothetical protein
MFGGCPRPARQEASHMVLISRSVPSSKLLGEYVHNKQHRKLTMRNNIYSYQGNCLLCESIRSWSLWVKS